jgi:dipeptidase
MDARSHSAQPATRNDADDMMYSTNIFEAAQQKGWWKPATGPLDFTSVYGDGELHHPYYSLRRVWRARSLVAPSLQLAPRVEKDRSPGLIRLPSYPTRSWT